MHILGQKSNHDFPGIIHSTEKYVILLNDLLCEITFFLQDMVFLQDMFLQHIKKQRNVWAIFLSCTPEIHCLKVNWICNIHCTHSLNFYP